jgi:hypothetical protein
MNEELTKLLPEQAIDPVSHLLNELPVTVVAVRGRRTKHGDFRSGSSGKPRITVNSDLNPYHFLLTLLHELAHYKVFASRSRDTRPHGPRWKSEFRELAFPFLNPQIFPMDLLPHLARYFMNPKASTSADPLLLKALMEYDENSGKNFIFELQVGSRFKFRSKTYIRGAKRRTRYECVRVEDNRMYLFPGMAEIEPLQ